MDDRTRSVGDRPRAADATAGLRLIVFCGGQVSSHVLPQGGEVVIGRGEDAGVRIEHATVSRRHATLLLGRELSIVDHGSFNGTTIGGAKIAPNLPQPVALSTIVELGETMLVVQIEGAAPVTGSRSLGNSAVRSDQSPAMVHLYRLVDNVAQSNITVVVRGETGVGKELIAEEIHRRSSRGPRGPLIKVKCAALPEAILEGELLGYERDVFTGSAKGKPGLIEAADGGTLFLDEIGEMPLATQAKLLDVVESREVIRLGSLRPTPVDVRFVAATHRDLEEMVALGQLRQDLYYRLAGVTLIVPPLRDRVSEIPRIAEELVARFCRDARRPAVPISGAAMRVLKEHVWPGNVRELRNVMERAVVFSNGAPIAPEQLGLPLDHLSRPPGAVSEPPRTPRSLGAMAAALPPMPPAPSAHVPVAPIVAVGPSDRPPPSSASATMAFGSASLPVEMEALERQRILDALTKCGGNQTQAAELLGISRRTLLRRLDEYAVPRPRK